MPQDSMWFHALECHSPDIMLPERPSGATYLPNGSLELKTKLSMAFKHGLDKREKSCATKSNAITRLCQRMYQLLIRLVGMGLKGMV